MKKSLFLLAALSYAAFACGQGMVNFWNFPKTAISTNSVHNGPSTGLMTIDQGSPSGPGAYYFALFAAPSTVTSVTGVGDPNWEFTGIYATNEAYRPGVFTGPGFGIMPNNPAYLPGMVVSFFAIGWSANIGATWAQAEAWYHDGNPLTTGWFGLSGVATGNILGGGTSSDPTPFDGNTTIGRTGGWLLNRYDPIPEPSSRLLLGLAVAALLVSSTVRRPKGSSP